MQAVTSAALAVVKKLVVFQPSHSGDSSSVAADSPQASGAKTASNASLQDPEHGSPVQFIVP